MTEQKQYTLEELKEKLIKELFNTKLNIDYDKVYAPEMLFADLVKSIDKVIKDLGIKINYELESDFKDCLDEIHKSKIGNSPTKKRFE